MSLAPPADAYRTRESCRLCSSRALERVLSLTPTPPANAFVTAVERDRPQPVFPLDLHFCRDCGHVQLLTVVDPRVLFENYVYVSGTSPVFVRHFEAYADDVMRYFSLERGALAVDIGSNDGTLLGFFQKAGLRILGIDPAKAIAEAATARGIPTIAGFFTPASAARIRAEHGPAAVITANNVFAHIDDLSGVTEGVRSLLSPDGVFVFEVSYLVDVIEKTLFDTIYHEHLCYHSVRPLIPFFRAHGMELIEAIRVDSHGGSLRGIARLAGGKWPVGASVAAALETEAKMGLERPDTFRRFGQNIDAIGVELAGLLKGFKRDGRAIAGFGAPAKATTLMYHFGIGSDIIDFIVDDSPLKQGLFSPGLHVPVVPGSVIAERHPDYLVVLAWNFAASIIAKNAAYRDRGGHFIVPLPRVEVV